MTNPANISLDDDGTPYFNTDSTDYVIKPDEDGVPYYGTGVQGEGWRITGSNPYISYTWTGDENNSASTESVDGVVQRTNLVHNPETPIPSTAFVTPEWLGAVNSSASELWQFEEDS